MGKMMKPIIVVPVSLVLVVACAQVPFARQKEIDRCAEIVGVEDSVFRLKQVATPTGVEVTVQQFENMTLGQRRAVEDCIEAQVANRGAFGQQGEDPDVVVVEVVEGKLALPSEYPLLPGDRELWNQLSLEEQERAIEFLKNGSTIQASLGVD